MGADDDDRSVLMRAVEMERPDGDAWSSVVDRVFGALPPPPDRV
jgi:hypothetical protein